MKRHWDGDMDAQIGKLKQHKNNKDISILSSLKQQTLTQLSFEATQFHGVSKLSIPNMKTLPFDLEYTVFETCLSNLQTPLQTKTLRNFEMTRVELPTVQIPISYGCILATSFGTGKTYVSLALIQHLGQHVAVILRPHLISHWESEVKKHVKNENQHLFTSINTKHDPFEDKKYFLISSNALVPDSPFWNLHWDMVVIDEVHLYTLNHSEKNFINHVHRLNCSRMLLLTSTPDKNYEMTLKLLGGTAIFLALKEHWDIDNIGPNLKRRLSKTIRSYILSSVCIVGKNIKSTSPTIFRHPIAPDSEILFTRQLLDSSHLKKDDLESLWVNLCCTEQRLGGIDENQKSIQNRHRCIKKTTGSGTKKNSTGYPSTVFLEDSCSICTNPYEHPHVLACGHVFCFTCLKEWWEISFQNQKMVCPLCKKRFLNYKRELGPRKRWLLRPEIIEHDHTIHRRDEIEHWITSFLDSHPSDQLLIYGLENSAKFADDCIRNYFPRKKKWDPNDLTEIERFQRGKVQFLCLDIAREQCTGFDFPNVKHVLILDFKDPLNLHQAMSRAGCIRGASTVQTNVHIFFRSGGIEEFMMGLKGSTPIVKPTQTLIMQLEYFMLHELEGSRMWRLSQELQRKNLGIMRFDHRYAFTCLDKDNINHKCGSQCIKYDLKTI